MVRQLLVRGMLVGLVAGVLAIVFAKVFGEPQVARAIAFEGSRAGASGEPAGPDLVSRTVQNTAGLATAVSVYAVAFGGLFALAFAVANGRFGQLRPRATSALLALAGFITVELVPFLKYPANPPSVGNADTIGTRTVLYFTMIGISLLAAAAAIDLAKRLMSRQGLWNAVLIAAAAFIVAIGVVEFLMPTVNEVPADFPAVVLWRFRVASLGTQAVLWTTFGVLFGLLTERSLTPSQARLGARHPASLT